MSLILVFLFQATLKPTRSHRETPPSFRFKGEKKFEFFIFYWNEKLFKKAFLKKKSFSFLTVATLFSDFNEIPSERKNRLHCIGGTLVDFCTGPCDPQNGRVEFIDSTIKPVALNRALEEVRGLVPD